jgi:pentafunctional AROM polypeptide
MSLLRRVSPLPIVFTVRSEGQIGKFPKDPDRIFALLKEGLRAGAEWIDVEACWPQSHITDLTALIKSTYASTSRILGSLHVTVPQTEEQITELFRACDLDGAADMVKVVTGAANDADCRLVHTCGERAPKPYIGLCLGAPGSLSRVLNRRFTPVTHALMATAAPGQLTAAQLMERRLAEGLLTQRKYFLFGTPIQQSMSPAMHNAAYRALLLPHDYGLCESDSVEMYEAVLQDPSFGGASVTIPHKESIGRFLDEVSTEAKSIGAVNTVARVEGRLVGYNTDWLGIKLPISRLMSTQEGRTKGLVVGAGGTARAACFALKSLGLEVLVYNRSPEKGEELARLFGGTFVSDLSVLPCDELAAVVSTVPAQAQFTLPAEVIAQRPIVLDVVYKPVRTPLVEQALAGDCPCIQGATMLLEQGVQQFEIWNQRRAPRSEMDAAVFSGIDRI